MRTYQRPQGWRNESHRHYLASKGVPTKKYMAHKYMYTPTYVAADMPLIATDAVGTAGAATVSLIPVVVPFAILGAGISILEKRKKKTGHYFAEKEEPENFSVLPEFEGLVPPRKEKEKRVAAKEGYFDKKVDLKRYAGTWKQESVENEPWFQKGCKDVKAKYTPLPDGTVRVINTCDGRKIEGRAVPVSADNRKLEVSFGPFQKGDYNIKSVNEDYTRAVVKSGKTTWVLRKVS